MSEVSAESVSVKGSVGEILGPRVVVVRVDIDLLIFGRGEGDAERLSPQFHPIFEVLKERIEQNHG